MHNVRRETLVAIALFSLVLFGNATVFAIVPYVSLPQYGFGYHPFQIMLCYSALATLGMLPWALRQGRKGLTPTRWDLYFLRAGLEFVCFCLTFYALQYLDLPKHIALNFLSPLLATLVAMAVLKERSYSHTWIALALGFVGMLMITRPGVIPFNIGVVYVLAAAFGFSFCGSIIKLLTVQEPPERIAFYLVGLTALIALPFGLYHWKAPTVEGWYWLGLIGLIACVQQVLVARAIAKVPFITLIPLHFIQLIFASAYSYIFYAKAIDRWTFLGALVILAATLYNAWRNTVRAARIRNTAKDR